MSQLPTVYDCTVKCTFFYYILHCLPKVYPGEDAHQTGHTDLLVHSTGAVLGSFRLHLGYRKHDVCPKEQHCRIVCVLCGWQWVWEEGWRDIMVVMELQKCGASGMLRLLKCPVQCEFIICSVKECIILLTHCKLFVKSLVFSASWRWN